MLISIQGLWHLINSMKQQHTLDEKQAFSLQIPVETEPVKIS